MISVVGVNWGASYGSLRGTSVDIREQRGTTIDPSTKCQCIQHLRALTETEHLYELPFHSQYPGGPLLPDFSQACTRYPPGAARPWSPPSRGIPSLAIPSRTVTKKATAPTATPWRFLYLLHSALLAHLAAASLAETRFLTLN